jgi:hypothetical protein
MRAAYDDDPARMQLAAAALLAMHKQIVDAAWGYGEVINNERGTTDEALRPPKGHDWVYPEE